MPMMWMDSAGGMIRWQDIAAVPGQDEGPPILLLPGLSMPVAGTFMATAADPALSGRRRILLDYLGSGASDHPEHFDYSLHAHADSVARVLDQIGCGPVEVVGHSMGGTVAIVLAQHRPDLVSRVVVAEANLFPGGGEASRSIHAQGEAAFLSQGCDEMLEWMRRTGREGAAWADRLYAGWRVADPKGIFGNAVALVELSDGFMADFAAMSIPRAFVYGSETLARAPAPDVPDRAALHAAGVTAHVVPGAGHMMMGDNPQGWSACLRAALA